MKILKNNYTASKEQIKPYPRKLICESCKSELEYEESDLRMGEYGCVYLDCPVCEQDNMIEDNENCITLTADNIEFPTHFGHISKENGAKDVFTNERIETLIRRAIEYFRDNKEEYDWGGWHTGNLFIHVHKFSGDGVYGICVSNDFYKAEIPFEEEDY